MPPYENADTRPHTTNMKEMMTMKNVVKKIGMMLLTMVIVSFFAFLAFQVIPAVAALRAELGLDRPFFTRYFEWVLHALQGDFGTSYVYSMPVAQLLNGKLGVTALLTAIAFVLIVLVSLPVGLFAASRQGGWLDRALTVLGQVVMAVPPFVVGILLTLVCGLILHWFDPGAFIAPAQSFWSSVGYLLYPAVAIALPRIAMTVKMLKSSITEELGKDYVRTAYSRGNSPPCAAQRRGAHGGLSGHDGGGHRGGQRHYRAGLCHPRHRAAAADLHRQPGFPSGAGHRGDPGAVGGAGELPGRSSQPAAGSPAAAAIRRDRDAAEKERPLLPHRSDHRRYHGGHGADRLCLDAL